MKKKTLKKKIHQYTAVFQPDLDAGGYTVTIPSLPGCISEGDNFEEAQENIKEAASLYLEVMQEQRDPVIQEDQGVIIAPIQIKA